jgi:hypothetical protein
MLPTDPKIFFLPILDPNYTGITQTKETNTLVPLLGILSHLTLEPERFHYPVACKCVLCITFVVTLVSINRCRTALFVLVQKCCSYRFPLFQSYLA